MRDRVASVRGNVRKAVGSFEGKIVLRMGLRYVLIPSNQRCSLRVSSYDKGLQSPRHSEESLNCCRKW
jgi:hypothetical protein